MASAYFDPAIQAWKASFRGLFQRGVVRTRLRIPLDQLRHGQEKSLADAYAKHLDRLCRLCESQPKSADIDQAEAAGAITPDQAAALRTGARPPITGEGNKPVPMRILALARTHPSSRRERTRDILRHESDVTAFTTWAGTDRIEALTIERVDDWLRHLTEQGRTYDGRRHALLWLRRAARMAMTHGYPDALSGMILNRREQRPVIRAWTFAELGELLRGAARYPDHRLYAAVLLGGFAGLRDSEMFRLVCGDLDGHVLHISRTKNRASIRSLPLPDPIVDALRPLVHGQPADAHLFRPTHVRTKRSPDILAFCDHTFPRWFNGAVWGDHPTTPAALARAIAAPAPPYRPHKVPPAPSAIGACPRLRRLPMKSLRKAFMSWTIRAKHDTHLIERWAGHTISGIAAVSERHYFADLDVTELEPIADVIGAAIQRSVAHPTVSAA